MHAGVALQVIEDGPLCALTIRHPGGLGLYLVCLDRGGGGDRCW